jgi:hypothetical protein
MKTIFKFTGGLIKIALIGLLIALVTPPIYFFGFRANEPLPQKEFKGLSYNQYVEWRAIAMHDRGIAYDAKNPNSKVLSLDACSDVHTTIYMAYTMPQAFFYTLAALRGAKPTALYPLPTNVTFSNFLPKWWDAFEYLLWENDLEYDGIWAPASFNGPCYLDPSVKVPTPAELDAIKHSRKQANTQQ